MVATCAHLLVALQWRLIDTELDAGTELEVAHGQADGSWLRQEVQGSVARGAR
jgi:hypothetical protein